MRKGEITTRGSGFDVASRKRRRKRTSTAVKRGADETVGNKIQSTKTS